MTSIITSELGPGAPSSPRGTIAVDMDDVLAQTNRAIIHMHNELFPEVQPPIRFEEFKHCLFYSRTVASIRLKELSDLYWKNRGWGTAEQTAEKVRKLLDNDLLMKSPPVTGAKEGLEKLKKMGYRIVIITARSEVQRTVTEDWLAMHMPDIIDEIHFTGAFTTLLATKEEREGHAARKAVVSHKKRTKAEVVHQTHALFLVDDSAENALDCASADPPVRVLLFGEYGWNRVVLRQEERAREDGMTYVDLEREGKLEDMEKKRDERVREGWLPRGVERVSGWEQVVHWVEKNGPGAGSNATGGEEGSGGLKDGEAGKPRL